MLRTATRRAMLYPEAAATAAGDWWTWLDASYTVHLAMDFRSAASLADATKIGDTPTAIVEPGGGVNLSAAGLTMAGDTVLETSAFALTQECSIIARARQTTAGRQTLVGSNNTAYQIMLEIDSTILRCIITGFYIKKTGALSTTTMGTCATTSASNSNADVYMYYDGSDETVAEPAYTSLNNTGSTIKLIGARTSSTQRFYGVIESVALTTGVVSPSDMATLHTLMSA